MTSAIVDTKLDNYASLYNQFRWHVPALFNIAEACCARWASDKSRVAMHYEDESGHTATLTYVALQAQVHRMSNVLRSLGVRRGERIAIMLPQRPETAIAHMACFQIGAVAMPLPVSIGADALEYRLQHSEAVVVIADQQAMHSLTEIRMRCPLVLHVIAVDCDGPITLDWYAEIAKAPSGFQPVKTHAGDPALLIYNSDTCIPSAAKGVLLPHCAMIGNLPGFVASQNWLPKEGDVFWSPADWACTPGLMDALLPTLYFGKPIVGYHGPYSAQTAFRLLEKYEVTNAFLFPSVLKDMMQAAPAPHERYKLKLRAVMSTGEALDASVFHWCRSALGITVNEMFGQTEMNHLIGNSADQWPARPGSMGRPYPGHRIAVIDRHGKVVEPGETGEVALNRTDIHGFPDPVLFLEYWKDRDATQNKYSGDWCRTGDLAMMDEDGYLWHRDRAEDMFDGIDGHRIGPSKIESCLRQHRAVANAAVAPKPPKPDAGQRHMVKAFIVLGAGVKRNRAADDKLIADLQAHVRGKLAPWEYPNEIEFVDELPMSANGKLQRSALRLLEEERAADR